MLFAIRPWETTTLICGCAQETGCAPPWFWAAAGAASTAKTAVVARRRLIRRSYRHDQRAPLELARIRRTPRQSRDVLQVGVASERLENRRRKTQMSPA